MSENINVTDDFLNGAAEPSEELLAKCRAAFEQWNPDEAALEELSFGLGSEEEEAVFAKTQKGVTKVGGFTNSSLVNFSLISPNRNAPRQCAISRITPHCVVGQASVESLGYLFYQTSRQASSNYGIGADARVGMYCPESDRSWCSSSPYNDHRAVTIECASDNYHPYAFNWSVYLKLVDLCVDICRRNGKNKVVYVGHDNYNPASNEILLTLHRWYASTACPGDWLVARMSDLANRINEKLGSSPARDYLMQGDEGDAVKTMQSMLIACGYSCGKSGADGSFGPDTLAAVKKFQTVAKLDVDGLYGPKSKAALEKAYKEKGGKVETIYYVQAGAYKQKANAEKQVQKLKAAGFNAIVKQLGTIYKVQTGAYKTKANAEKQLAALKAKGFSAFIAN